MGKVCEVPTLQHATPYRPDTPGTQPPDEGSPVADEDMTIGEISRTLKRLERMVAENISDHERRLRVVERWMWTALGLSAAGAGTGLWSLLGGA